MNNKQSGEKEPEKRITFRVPEWMHKAAKVKAAQEGKSIERALSELVEAWLKDNPQPQE